MGLYPITPAEDLPIRKPLHNDTQAMWIAEDSQYPGYTLKNNLQVSTSSFWYPGVTGISLGKEAFILHPKENPLHRK